MELKLAIEAFEFILIDLSGLFYYSAGQEEPVSRLTNKLKGKIEKLFSFL